MSELDTKVLELALLKISEAFDEFVGACTDDRGQPKQPDINHLMKAKGYLPPYCKNAFSKKR